MAILALKDHGSTLPIELWHVESNWLTDDQKEFLQNLGNIKVRYSGDHAQSDSTAMMVKSSFVATALFYSAFEEILYLSSETLALQNLDALFENDGYLKHGALFFPGFS
jgi:hypothetical protein